MADNKTQQLYNTELNRARDTAGTFEDAYQQKALNFDAGASFRQYADGAYQTMKLNLGKDLRTLGGREASAGRVDSGFYDQDQGEVVKENAARYESDIASHAMDAAGLQERHNESLGAYAQNARGTQIDMISGLLDRQQAERNARAKRRAALLGGAMSLAGTAIGAAVGGGGGAMVGGQIGGALGGATQGVDSNMLSAPRGVA